MGAGPLYDPRVRAIIYQILVLGLVILAGWWLVANTLQNLSNQSIATGFGFLDRPSSFEISESLITYSAAESYRRAFIVGLLNTLKVSILGIVVASILGVIIGVARLSTNWLVAKVAKAYVEVMRNIPLLLQLFVWYGVITISLPSPRQAMEPIPDVFLSNRGFKFPVPAADPVHAWMGIALVVGIIASIGIAHWARRRRDLTGQPFPTGKVSTALIVGLPVLAWIAGGAPTTLDVPVLQGFNFQGGLTISPEFAALLIGLSTYTAAFIAEIVRGGILAVSHGQTEAARSLGLTPNQTLRLVVLPQALRVIIPPTTSQFLNLTKNSSLAVGIGYPDLVSVGNTTLNQTGQAIEAISIFMAVYLGLSLAISAFMNWYNRKIALKER